MNFMCFSFSPLKKILFNLLQSFIFRGLPIMENRPYSQLIPFLSTVSVKALNSASRLVLTNNLDRKQLLLSEKGFARDYRGFAELIGFPYRTIKKFEESEDRTLKILKAWESRPDAMLDKLIDYLEKMDRYDVIEDFLPSLG